VVGAELDLGILALRDGLEHVPLGEDPGAVGVRVEHDRSTDLALGHQHGGLL